MTCILICSTSYTRDLSQEQPWVQFLAPHKLDVVAVSCKPSTGKETQEDQKWKARKG